MFCAVFETYSSNSFGYPAAQVYSILPIDNIAVVKKRERENEREREKGGRERESCCLGNLLPLCLTQHYKVGIKGKVEQSKKKSRALQYISVVVIEKGAFGSSLTTFTNFTLLIYIYI